MDKRLALQQIRLLVQEARLTREEVLSACEPAAAPSSPSPLPSKTVESAQVPLEERPIGIAEMLYYIGGAIVYLGIGILVYQNWDALTFPLRLGIPLGAGIAAYALGMAIRTPKLAALGGAFHLIGILTLPIGLAVLCDQLGYDIGRNEVQAVVAGALTLLYAVTYALSRRTIMALASILFISWCYVTGGFYLFQSLDQSGIPVSDYLFLILGVIYLGSAYLAARSSLRPIASVLYTFGSLFVLSTSFQLGGLWEHTNPAWEIAYPFIVFALLYLSVYARNKAVLIFATLGLMAYIFKITSEYFAEGFGWPISLIIAGLLIICVGALSVFLNNKYLKA